MTGFLDLFAAEDQIFGLRERLARDPASSADLYAAGPCLTATGGHCSEYGIPTRIFNTPEEARQQVTELVAKQPDVVKVVYAPTGEMPSVDKATLAAAVGTATAYGIPSVIHIQTV